VTEAQQGYLVELIGAEADAERHYVTCAGHALRALRLAPAGGALAEEAEAMLQVAYQRLRSEPIDIGSLNRLALRLPLHREGMIARLTLASVQARAGRIGEARFTVEVLRGDAARLGETVVRWVATAWLAQLDEYEVGETEATRQWRRLAVHHLSRLWDDRVGRFEALLMRRRLLEASATVDRERAQLWEDALTAVGNRRMLDRLLAVEQGGERATAFLDVDWFKQINDRFGHAVGDEVLRRVAVILTDVRRGADVVVRYGGDEFVVVLADHGDVAGFAHRVRTAVADHPWHEVARGLAVSVTVGTADAGPRALVRAEESLRAAKAARTTG
jgi:diguanylate cyclase (GGDEF)-like protein